MYTRFLFRVIVILLVVVASVPAFAAKKMDPGPLKLVTGPSTGTYYRIGTDIKDALKGFQSQIEVTESKGSIDNINLISGTGNASLGIVQSDVIGFLARSEQKDLRNLADRLRMVYPLYHEEVHLMARGDINTLAELAGKTVVVGAKGSGTWLTSVNILKITGIRPGRILRITPEEGLLALLQGKADALFAVGGKPLKVFQNFEEIAQSDEYKEAASRIYFIPLDLPELLTEYRKSELTKNDYALVRGRIPTIALTAVLISYNFASAGTVYAQKRCEQIRQFSQDLAERLDWLRGKGHDKWREVSFDNELSLWKKDECAEGGASPSLRIENDLLEEMQR